ncbi:hypothetical protein [Stenotrophomonas sp. UBA7606]|uniref:hypothetical protein n=1 Tax=Stenotrophomonas sp. UBA7606 TaxID=1947559 RepID=UPI0025CBCC55|nr:hypothetical protein [Stenotrophomonas sp. UBA7606]
MQHDDDTTQPTTPAPKRGRGRPKLYDTALTPAERARRYRMSRQRDNESVAECRDSVLMERLRRALKNKEVAADAQAALDLYLDEMIRRHHSRGADRLK